MQTPDVDGHETVVPGAVPPRGGGRRTRWLVGLVALGLLLAFSVVALVCALLDLADGGWRPVGDAVLVLSVAAVVGGHGPLGGGRDLPGGAAGGGRGRRWPVTLAR